MSETQAQHRHAHYHHATVVEPRFSLLRLSAFERLMGAAALVGSLWLAVWWAL